MTDISAPPQPLGIGAIISESFSIFFKRLIPIFLVGFVTYFVISVISGAILGFDVVTGQSAPFDVDAPGGEIAPSAAQIVGMVLAALLGILAQGLVVAVVVLMAYDTKLGRPLRMSGYIGAALPVAPMVFLVSLVVGILIGIGFLLFIVPGLWLAAVFSVVIPAVVIERAGFGALGRSSDLTKGYRWSIVGLYIVMFLIAIVLATVIGGLLLGLAAAVVSSESGAVGILGGMTLVAADAVASALSYGFTAVMSALIYARLREIKEGIGVDSLADVFR